MNHLISFRNFLLAAFIFFVSGSANGQGHWVPVAATSPNYFNGVTVLLSDGTIMVKACHGGIDTDGNLWNKLTPDIYGSYINGTWSTVAAMHQTRLYCSSQLLTDGRLYVAGGEYGTGSGDGETYNPLTDTWTMNGSLPNGYQIYDGNSELLPTGNVLQNIVSNGSTDNCIYNPRTNTYATTPPALASDDESAWLKLPDNSILYVNDDATTSERYIPALNEWIGDATLPVALYDSFDGESGPAFLLPDGNGFFIGSASVTAIYTPSGSDASGTWVAGPAIPGNLGAPDAAGAMLPNGKILCALSHTPVSVQNYPMPTYFYEFDYRSRSFAQIPAPAGGDSINISSYATSMLNLPDGTILFATLDSNKFYVYVPDGTPLAAGQPVIDSVFSLNCDTFVATGVGFNGISQGADYGDDWQMPTNYPIIKLTSGSDVTGTLTAYARTFNWNATGVMTGNSRDTAYFTLPPALPQQQYGIAVVANGISSASVPFIPCADAAVPQPVAQGTHFTVYPNPAASYSTVAFNANTAGRYRLLVLDALGREALSADGNCRAGTNNTTINVSKLTPGNYTVMLRGENLYATTLLVVP